MLVLGKCIRQLKEQGSSSKKIPISYRESKLTHILKNFFEPINRQSKAGIVINVSPAIIQLEDTVFALQFAAEASQCVIRQVAIQESEPSSDDDPEIVQQIEAEIRNAVTDEMEEWFAEKRERIMKEIAMIEVLTDRYSRSVEDLKDELGAITMRNRELETTVEKLRGDIAAVASKEAHQSHGDDLFYDTSARNEAELDSGESSSRSDFADCPIRLPTIAEELQISDEMESDEEDDSTISTSNDPQMISIPHMKQ
jgi:archaellum component FlaC